MCRHGMLNIKAVQEPQDRTPSNRDCLLSIHTTMLWCDDTYGGAAQAAKAEESGQVRLFVLVLRQEDRQMWLGELKCSVHFTLIFNTQTALGLG